MRGLPRRARVLGVQLEQGLAEHRRAVGALARWSSIGVPSSASTSAAARTVSSVQGWPTSAASVARARIGVAATPPSPIARPAHDAVGHVEREATATLEMSSKRRLAILWNAVSRASGRGRIRISLISSPGSAHALPVAGEVVGQRHHPLARDGGQHQPRLEREQRGRRVADRRAGAEVAAERGAVADQPGRELREHLGQQRDLAVQPALDLGERQRGAEPDLVGARRSARAARGAGRWRPPAARAEPRRLTSTPQSVRPGDEHRIGPLGEQLRGPRPGPRAGRARRRPRRSGSAARPAVPGRGGPRSASSAAGSPSAYAASLIGR